MTDAIPTGHEGIVPHLVIEGCAKAIEFYKNAFNAQEGARSAAPDGRKVMHAEIRIGGRPIYLSDDFPEFCGGKSRAPSNLGASCVTIHRYVEDCDAAIKRAEKAGATVTMPPQDMFWGDRYGKVTDPFGHEWSFAAHIKDMSPQEMESAAQAAFP